jgi:hypothetical protein
MADRGFEYMTFFGWQICLLLSSWGSSSDVQSECSSFIKEDIMPDSIFFTEDWQPPGLV